MVPDDLQMIVAWTGRLERSSRLACINEVLESLEEARTQRALAGARNAMSCSSLVSQVFHTLLSINIITTSFSMKPICAVQNHASRMFSSEFLCRIVSFESD